MKIRKWTIFLGLGLTIMFALILPLVLTNKEAAVKIAYEQKKEAAIDKFKDQLILSVAAINVDNEPIPESAMAPPKTEKQPTTNEGSVEAQLVAAAITTEDVTEDGTPLGANATPSSGGEVKDEWIQSKIDSNRGNISDADLDRGSEIYNSLDTRYIFGLADGGLTPEERLEVDTYLRSQLSGSDYELAKSLYFKYVGLLAQ